ncbi:polysaccharide lyase [Pelagicoccus albus]|uniref:Polysaccharide lyase n=1 Tax=Pelagicoccus albus TaxID=415222 RepID=A0A7X1B3Z5_9BACT|nr:polysaccharide lyase [Pelagicoccus albus]MBC2605228.1 polysaccharide lyase [Pelagicoccus albus]
MLISPTYAGYPTISDDVQAESDRLKAIMQQNSDAAWEKALPVIQEWEAKGKPYIPSASHPDDLPQADIPAFPGAQGGGMYSFGGRGGKVFVVTNLNDRGPGSFREACEAGGPRIVVFNVAGIIKLEERLIIRAPYITIAGGTAPGDGVCIAGDTVELETHDVVIRQMRFRRGETWVGDRNDSLGGNPIGNIMIDHVSASWGLDENMSMYRHMYDPGDGSKKQKLPTVNITIQNSIFSEALDTYDHAFGSTIGGYNSTFHHNLWASNTGRNASVGMIYDFTFANNVIFNWRHRTTDGGDHRSYYSMINNYYKPGPVTPEGAISHRIIKPEARRSKFPINDFGRVYASGNVIEGNEKVTADNWAGGVQLEKENGVVPERKLPEIRIDKPYPHSYLEITSAEQAYEDVLENAGATLPKRDPVDERIVKMVRTGEVLYKEGKGIITDIKQVGGYPEYHGKPYKDSDGDGMPDKWEKMHGLNPKDASDASADLNGDGYTNIEDFINGMDPSAPAQKWETPRTYKDLFWNPFN